MIFIALTDGDKTVLFEKAQINCQKFKTGVFILKSPVDKTAWKIERSDSIQIETDLNTGTKTVRALKWLNDCEYELTQQAKKTTLGDSTNIEIRKKPIITRIVKTAKDYYVFESRREGIDKRYSDTLWVFRKQ